ncbi:hypothetical protein AM228_12425 [Planktothricoides sp. SR001]|nr:hypothetical protein AM228_12425 [Planktothricoides sp. SR001]
MRLPYFAGIAFFPTKETGFLWWISQLSVEPKKNPVSKSPRKETAAIARIFYHLYFIDIL